MDKVEEEFRLGNKTLFLKRVRQALIILLGAIEDYLGMERSIVPRHKRQHSH